MYLCRRAALGAIIVAPLMLIACGGVLARQAGSGAGVDSVNCGRLIRKAWVTGAAL